MEPNESHFLIYNFFLKDRVLRYVLERSPTDGGHRVGLQQYVAICKYWDTSLDLDNMLYCIGGTWFAELQYWHLMGHFLKEINLDIFKPFKYT